MTIPADLLAHHLTPTCMPGFEPPELLRCMVDELENELLGASPILDAIDEHGWDEADVTAALARGDEIAYMDEEEIDLEELRSFRPTILDLETALRGCVAVLEQLEPLLGDDESFATALRIARDELEPTP